MRRQAHGASRCQHAGAELRFVCWFRVSLVGFRCVLITPTLPELGSENLISWWAAVVRARRAGERRWAQSSGCGPPYFSVEMLGKVKTDRRHRWRKTTHAELPKSKEWSLKAAESSTCAAIGDP